MPRSFEFHNAPFASHTKILLSLQNQTHPLSMKDKQENFPNDKEIKVVSENKKVFA